MLIGLKEKMPPNQDDQHLYASWYGIAIFAQIVHEPFEKHARMDMWFVYEGRIRNLSLRITPEKSAETVKTELLQRTREEIQKRIPKKCL